MINNRQNIKYFLLPILVFILATFIVTFPLIAKVNSGLYGPFYTTDIRGSVWSLWWTKYAHGHHLKESFCSFISVPYGVDFSHSPTFALADFPVKFLDILTSPVAALNIMTMVGFILCGLFSYCLLFHLTQSRIASLTLALAFTFSPYHLNKVAEFSYVFIADWVVLFVLCFIRLKERQDFKNIVCCAVALGLALAFNIYYAFFCLLFILGFFIYSFFYQWKVKTRSSLKTLKDRLRPALKFSGALFFAGVGAFLLNAPSLINILGFFGSKSITSSQKADAGFVRSFDYLVAQSARPLSYLLPASTHPVFGSFTKSMFGSLFYGRGPIEQTLYVGWSVLFLSFLAFRHWKTRRLNAKVYPDYPASGENFYIGFFIFTAWFAFISSMPPVLNLGLFKIYFPSYYIYKVLPMLRAYARFGVFVMLSLSVLAAFGMKWVLAGFKSKKIKIVFSVSVLCFMMFEFTNMPPSRVADLTRIPPVYQWLERQAGDFVVAEYPFVIAAAGEAQENYNYLYFQTIHQKRLVNGASAGTESFELKKKIARIDDPSTPKVLKSIGVKYVIFHSRDYASGEYRQGVDVIGEIPRMGALSGYRLIERFGEDEVYEVLG